VSSDILDLPDDRDAEALMLTNETCEPITTPPIVTRENIGKMIDICYGKMMAKGSLL
jgi:hypothetical protein